MKEVPHPAKNPVLEGSSAIGSGKTRGSTAFRCSYGTTNTRVTVKEPVIIIGETK